MLTVYWKFWIACFSAIFGTGFLTVYPILILLILGPGAIVLQGGFLSALYEYLFLGLAGAAIFALIVPGIVLSVALDDSTSSQSRTMKSLTRDALMLLYFGNVIGWGLWILMSTISCATNLCKTWLKEIESIFH